MTQTLPSMSWTHFPLSHWTSLFQEDVTPFLTRILKTAAQTKYAQAHNKIKTSQKMCKVVTRQLLYQSSNRCLGFQAEFGLFLWSTGCARQTIDAPFRCSLSVSYDSMLDLIESLSYHCDSRAIELAKEPHGMAYDNINLSTSIYVEQRGSDGPAKVQSGTFAVLYRLRNAFNHDVRPSLEELTSCHDQFVDIHIQQKVRRAIPVGYVTEQCPVRASTTEEVTTRGNLLFHDEIYLQHLKQIFQLGFGPFHLCLNWVWAILHVHRGTVNQAGSLSYFFAVMEKTRLGNQQPDYHTLLAALTQILDGLLLNAWDRECGATSLTEFAKGKPTPAKLREIAGRILRSDTSDTNSDYTDCAPEVNSPLQPQVDPKDDIAHHNIRLLVRDLLVLVAVVRTISDGDIGRVEVFLPHLAMMFRGAGCNKYCTEILHFILNLKYIWTPEFA
ncbi:hypothetical protein B0H17DRAFT_1157099 [Mycena rosella]|uniref:DUF6589 domain-containing protein n=1 Tax=Mycena rosella TaxID=1033263 RepID=A0AAD7E0I1_MYCRO|nr:hypothetical protein B0H17DRAFT_1157099 [Mycena rosella]